MQKIYKILDFPLIYRLARKILAPGAKENYRNILSKLLDTLPASDFLIDVGCGPNSLLFDVGKHPIGVDATKSYISDYTHDGGKGVVASAADLPFARETFDGSWCIAVLHHLPDNLAASSIREMMRVVKVGGYVIILDGVLPQNPWLRPIPAVVRKLDRGRFMRKQAKLETLLPYREEWTIERLIYTRTGMELVICKWFNHKGS